MIRLVRQHFWAIALLVVLAIGSALVVRAWKEKHPGSMSVLESQAMDMGTMKPPEGTTPVAVETVRERPFAGSVTYVGSVAPFEEQAIYSRVEGRLTNLSVYDGDTVLAGQLLAVIDSPDIQARVAEAAAGTAAAAYDTQVARQDAAKMASEASASRAGIAAAQSDVARARAMHTAAKRSVTRAEKEAASAKANAEYWRAEIRREENLFKAGAVSRQEYELETAEAAAAEAELGAKKAMLAEAQAQIDAAQAEVKGKESMLRASRDMANAASSAASGASLETSGKAAMRQQAQARLATAAAFDSYRYVRAPFAGVVTARYKSPGQFVTPSDAILTVVQIDRVRLQANVSDKDVGRVHVGDLVTARFTKDPSLVIVGEVTSVAPQADQESRTALVEAIVENPGGRLVPGDSVSFTIAASARESAITVPLSAVVQKDGRDAVWVVREEVKKGKSVYYCTMHPEVTRPKPGTCPTCIMKLVPKKSSSGKRASLVRVTLGQTGGGRVEVNTGLCDGDRVIYKGNTYLQEGEQVFPTGWTDDGPTKMPPPPAMESMPGMKHGGHDMRSMPEINHEGHDMESMPGMKPGGHDMESMPGMNRKDHKVRSQNGTKTYACPMHPEVTSHDPKARCKKCGMRLEEKK